MLETLSILAAAAEGASKGWEIGTGISDLWYGKNYGKIDIAFNLLSDYEEADGADDSSLKSAYDIFVSLQDDEKDYIRAFSLFGLAKCHAYMAEFDRAFSCLDELQNIELKFWQSRTDSISDIQKEGLVLEEEIKDLAKRYRNKKSSFSRFLLYCILVLAFLAIGYGIYYYLIK